MWQGVKDDSNQIGKLYDSASNLRQAKDCEWVANFLTKNEYNNFLDICCGSGKFIRYLIANKKISHSIVGIDKSPAMISYAKEVIENNKNTKKIDVNYICSNLFEKKPDLIIKFDLITLMSALHWLYPEEKNFFSWVHSIIKNDGEFCFTSYHPINNQKEKQDTDSIVLEALKRLNISIWNSKDFILMTTRTRSLQSIYRIIDPFFTVSKYEKKSAIMSVSSTEEYIAYHLATFGQYYSVFVPPQHQQLFFSTLGEIALERMRKFGYVTSMEVAVSLCKPRPKIKHN